MGLPRKTKNAERVVVGLNPYGQVRACEGMLFANQLRNPPYKSPIKIIR